MVSLRESYDALSEMGRLSTGILDSIKNNLNQKFELRDYQKEAIARFIDYNENYPKKLRPSQLLFHMATGSGKTLLMAADILYLYNQGYRNFLFFVNSTNIIEKTRDNFLNPYSSKYLFADKIVFEEKEVRIKEVQNFEAANQDDINIVFTTIQGLHSRLNTPQENVLTFEDFKDKKIAIISDEAHHINALTKSKLSKEETEELTTWEQTVKRLFNSNQDNIMLEFTATVELEHPDIKEKYENKIIYQYSLKEFRIDGYSKEIKILKSDVNAIERTLQALIVSQYRKKIAEKNKLIVKPVILIKSKTINESIEFESEFHKFIKNLKATDIKKIKNNTSNPSAEILKEAFEYFDRNSITLENLIEEFKEDFSEAKCISVNSKMESEEKQIIVNSLESPKNEVRVVFVVDMLNEGWDVLNLFDIVRLYETRDTKAGKAGRTTISEAQLIGRGARYYPFQLNLEQNKYKRKFDNVESELRVIEELYYHCSYNPKYIEELRKELVRTGIIPSQVRTINVKVKDNFKNSDFWKKGLIFRNKAVKNERLDVFSFSDIKLNTKFKHNLRTGYSGETKIFEGRDRTVLEKMTKSYRLADFGTHILRKSINKIESFKFSKMKKYFPHISSVNEFMTSDKFMKSVEVEVSGFREQINSINNHDKLEISTSILKKIAKEIGDGFYEYNGSKKFDSYEISETVKDKTLNVAVGDDDSEQEFGKGMKETTNTNLQLDLSTKDWYVYDENYGTSEEKYFVKFINSTIEKLKQAYSEIYLIRNEHLFKIYRFLDGAATEPDFVLFLKEKKTNLSLIYQLFVEAKGEQLIAKDKWKEEFLKEIKETCKMKTLHEDREFRLIGLPFYNESIKNEFESKFNDVLNIN